MNIKAIDIRKSVFLALSAVVMVVVFLSASVSAATNDISVKGGIPGYKPPVGSTITVTCGTQTNYPLTDDKGLFSTVFNVTSDCKTGSNVTGSFEMYYGTTKVNTNGQINSATLQLRKTEAVPEIGSIAAIASLVLVGGAIVYARRRQTQF